MKIMVTGSRYWHDEEAVHAALMAAASSTVDPRMPLFSGAELFVGDCPTGADEIAASWWRKTIGEDSLHVARSRGQRSYQLLARNQLLVDNMPDIVLGFALYGPGMSRGTNDALNRAREAGLYLVVQERPASEQLLAMHGAFHG